MVAVRIDGREYVLPIWKLEATRNNEKMFDNYIACTQDEVEKIQEDMLRDCPLKLTSVNLFKYCITDGTTLFVRQICKEESE